MDRNGSLRNTRINCQHPVSISFL